MTAHGLNTGDLVKYSTGGGTGVGGLTNGGKYYVIRIDANTIQLASSLANAKAVTPVAIDLSAVGAGALHTLAHPDNTDDNTAIGNDKWKLVNADNGATFATAQQMVLKLAEIFGSSTLAYHPADETLTFSLNLNETFGSLALPINFNFDDLKPLLGLQSSGNIVLSADGTLNLTVGVFLGAAPASTKLDGTEALNSLNNGVHIKAEQLVTAANDVKQEFGRLSGDATFKLFLDGSAHGHRRDRHQDEHRHEHDRRRSRRRREHRPHHRHLEQQGAGGRGRAQGRAQGHRRYDRDQADRGPVEPRGLGEYEPSGARSRLQRGSDRADRRRRAQDRRARSAAVRGRTSRVERRLPGQPQHRQRRLAGHGDGRSVEDAGQSQPARRDQRRAGCDRCRPVAQGQDQGRLDRPQAHLHRARTGATSFNITATAGNPAITIFGLAASNVGNSYEFYITLRDGTKHGVTLDGVTTLNGVIAAIKSQVGTSNIDVVIDDKQLGLKLIDKTSGPNMFKVESANGTTAAIDLGILKQDAPTPVAGVESEAPDGKIEGSAIGGVKLTDRFFIQTANFNVGLHMATPEDPAHADGDADTNDGIKATAKFGFVGVELAGGGNVNANFTMGLKDPKTVADDGRITLTELLGALGGDINTVVNAPALTGGGTIALDVNVNPSLPGLDLGSNPQIVFNIVNLGNPFTGQLPTVNFTMPDLGDLVDFDNLGFNFQTIIDGLKTLSAFLSEFESFGFLSQPLPLVNVSVNDLIGIADKFGRRSRKRRPTRRAPSSCSRTRSRKRSASRSRARARTCSTSSSSTTTTAPPVRPTLRRPTTSRSSRWSWISRQRSTRASTSTSISAVA
jgi:hypothetical protein